MRLEHPTELLHEGGLAETCRSAEQRDSSVALFDARSQGSALDGPKGPSGRREPGGLRPFRGTRLDAGRGHGTLFVGSGAEAPLIVRRCRQAVNFRRIGLSPTFRALAKPNVDVVTGGIKAVGENYVVTDDGKEHEIDTLILGTGFAASGFLAPMEVRGRQGLRLDAVWRSGAEAYLGITVSGFPNLFMLYGPNTNLGHNSIVYMLESQIRYITQAVLKMRSAPATSFDLRGDTQKRFNEKLQEALRSTVWATGCRSWYILDSGKIVNNWSGFTFVYRRLTRKFDLVNYEVLTSGTAAARSMGEPRNSTPLEPVPVTV